MRINIIAHLIRERKHLQMKLEVNSVYYKLIYRLLYINYFYYIDLREIPTYQHSHNVNFESYIDYYAQ